MLSTEDSTITLFYAKPDIIMPSSKDSMDCCLNSQVDIVMLLAFKRFTDKCYLLKTTIITLS